MARKKRDFDYMELYNPDYRAMKANMFDGISGSSVLDLQGQNGINTNWNFGQQQNNITAPNTMYSNITTVNDGTPAGSYVDPLQTEYHRVNPIKYLTMSEAERMRQNQLRQEARQERRENKQELTHQDSNQSNLGASLTNAIPAAANAMIAAFQDKNANTATRVATALGAPELGKIWSADWDKGNEQLELMQNRINDATNRYIQDSNDTQGAFSAIKENNKLNLIDTNPAKQLSWRDFRGNLFKKGAIATLQGAASGSIGGPWGALGGATVGTLGALFGGIGAKKRAKRAYNEYMDKMDYLQRYAGNFNSMQKLTQQQSNNNLLNSGLRQQRIQDLANINAYGGNLFATGGFEDNPELATREISPEFAPKEIKYTPKTADTDLQDAIAWNTNWLNQRRDLLYQNSLLKPANLSPQQAVFIAPFNNGYKETTPYYNNGSSTTKWNSMSNTDKANAILNSYLYNASSVDYDDRLPDKVGNTGYVAGVYQNMDMSYDKPHTIRLNKDKMLSTTPTHEVWHSLNAKVPQSAVAMKGINKPISGVYDDYLDNPDEILARRQEFARETGFNPLSIMTKEYLDANRDALKKYGLDRYSDANLIKLFNEVADNNNYNQYDNMAANGGQLDLSPNLINLQNQALDNQRYKYMNQLQPVGFMGGPGDKEPNPGFPRLACGGKLHLNKFDFGGSMNGMDIPTGMQSYENGGTHEENPNGGIQVGVDNQGTPNLVEEGEFRWGDYVFSNRIDVDLDVLSDFNVPATKRQGKKANKGKLSYADLAKKMAKKAGDLNDPITKDTLNENMKRASQAQDFQKAQMNSDNQLADYKNALKNQTQGNPMYGSMKYNGMGNVNQGLNEGSSAMEGVDNSSLSNVNRSGNAMMAAYGGNLYPDGGNIIISNTGVEFRKQPNGTWMSANGDTWSDEEMQQFVDNGEATMRPISTNPAIAVANDIVSKMNAPLSYGNPDSHIDPKNSYTPSMRTQFGDRPDFDYFRSFYQPIGKDQYITPTGVVDADPSIKIDWDYYRRNVDNTPLTWDSNQTSNTFTPMFDNIDLGGGFGSAQNGALGNGNIYNQQFGLGIRPDYVASKNPNKTVEAVSTYGKYVNGQIQYDPNGNPVMLYPNTFKGMNGKEQTMNSTFGNPINTTFTLDPVNVDTRGFYKFGNTQNTSSPTNSSSYSSASYKHSTQTPQKTGLEDYTPPLTPAESTQEGLSNSKDQAGIVDNRNLDEKHAQFATATTPIVPTLNTAGLYAQLGKGLTKNIYNWAGLANTEFKPNYKPEQDLRALGKTGYVPRTADHSGMYRAADLYDINAANNASQAMNMAMLRNIVNNSNGNRGFVGAQGAALDYNGLMGVGQNYATMFDKNNASRIAAYQDNKQTEQTNVAANNDMYRDNQQAGIQAKNFELSANTAANQMQWAKDRYADTQNRIAALNKQSDAARMADNQINFLVDKAKENAYYNLKNKDPRQMYWNDPSTGEWHFKGDNGYYNNLRRAMSGKNINSLDTTSNEELAAIADQKGWNNITEEDMKDIIDRQAEREKKISDDKKAKDAQDLRNAQIQYKQMLANIRAVNPDYNPGFKDSDFTTADDWLTGYNGLNTYWLSAINPYLANRKVDNESAYGGKIKTNKRNKNHSYDYMAI